MITNSNKYRVTLLDQPSEAKNMPVWKLGGKTLTYLFIYLLIYYILIFVFQFPFLSLLVPFILGKLFILFKFFKYGVGSFTFILICHLYFLGLYICYLPVSWNIILAWINPFP